MSSVFLRKTITITLENATLPAIERNIEAQRRVVEGKPLRVCDYTPLLDTATILELIKHEIAR